MYSHAPQNYKCPMCYIAQGKEEIDFPYSRQADVIYQDNYITSFIASHWWPNNEGHVIIIPNSHYESLYDIPEGLLGKVNQFSKKVALAFKDLYHCSGVTTRQHNEPDGGQDVWHYHLHIFPRYKGDQFYETTYMAKKSDPVSRVPYATRLKKYLESNPQSSV